MITNFGHIRDPHDLALVVFSGETNIWWLKVLKPGFRHCFAALHKYNRWIIYDPLAHRTDLQIHEDLDSVDLEYWFRQHGHTVIRTFIRSATPKKLSPAPFTCVEAIKRLLGLRATTILTPWQLFSYLENALASENPSNIATSSKPKLCRK